MPRDADDDFDDSERGRRLLGGLSGIHRRNGPGLSPAGVQHLLFPFAGTSPAP